ncbi:polysaccharide deacetylase family protein [Dokdonia ponticola]|uniref:Polysaccharide deacetylase family protein n=1 Tax=Dokdonia ponticola TaxID=2041041 RepID=A0ABV9HUE0_9FLAO
MRSFIRNVYITLAGTISKPSNEVHLINGHYVTKHVVDKSLHKAIYEEFILYLLSIGDIIPISDALDKINKKHTKNSKPYFVLTYDDGFEECFDIMGPILDKHNIKAAFFINANYIESNQDYQNNFNKRIRIETKRPMSWEQITYLHSKGHTIGSHTLDHHNLNKLSLEDIELQIKKNKEILVSKLNYNCDHFAWPYGRISDFSEEALEITSKYHKYIYSGTNYKFYHSFNNRVYNRRHLEADWKKSYIKYFLSAKKAL